MVQAVEKRKPFFRKAFNNTTAIENAMLKVQEEYIDEEWLYVNKNIFKDFEVPVEFIRYTGKENICNLFIHRW